MVLPLLKKNGYTFTALQRTEAFKKAYPVGGAPTNYLIDTEGRIVKHPRLATIDQERWLETWIEVLLPRTR